MAGRGCGFQRTAVDWTWTSTHVTRWIEIPLQGTAEVCTLFPGCPRVTGRHSVPEPRHLLTALQAGTLGGRFQAEGVRQL